jgi:hypothetical protein
MGPRGPAVWAVVLLAGWLLAAGTATALQRDGVDVLRSHGAEVLAFGAAVQDFLGPMPAIAGAPFLGLAAIAAATLLADTKFAAQLDSPFAQELRRNRLITEARAYASWTVVAVLLAIALLNYLSNSGKVQGLAGKLVDGGESVAALALYGALAASVGMPAAPRVAGGPDLLLAQFPALSGGLLMGVAVAAGLLVMLIVRWAFDLLIWLSPIPLVDLFFGTLKQAFTIGFVALYLLMPVVATILAAVILGLCLLMLPWALRLVRAAYRVILTSRVALARALHGDIEPTSPHALW